MVRKRADGRWEGRIIVGHKDDGKPIYKAVLAKTQKELIPKLNQLKETYAGVELTEASRMTLGEWFERWFKDYAEVTLRPSTVRGYRRYAKQINRSLGEKQIGLITTQQIQRMYNKLKRDGREKSREKFGDGLSDSTVRSIHMLLHEVMEAAVQARLIAKNPTNGTTVPKCNYPEKQILGDNQLETFLEAIKGHEYWCDFFYVEVMTGLRRGEICGLRWQDINFEENKLQVKRSVSVKKGGGVSIGETKTETGVRCIQMPPSVAELLKSKKQTAITEWVFPHFLHPEQPISPASAYRKLKVILKNAELPLIRFHDLRHTFATHATQGGVDPKTLAGILGHTNASFTLDTYTHVTSDMQKSASAVVGNMMQKIMIKE